MYSERQGRQAVQLAGTLLAAISEMYLADENQVPEENEAEEATTSGNNCYQEEPVVLTEDESPEDAEFSDS